MSNVSQVHAQDDGLYFDEVGSWTEDKHSLVALYDRLFSTGMKNKWDARIYVDLYAGPGLHKIRNANKFIWGSPMLALNLPDPFDKYVFCEEIPESMNALKQRVRTRFPSSDVEFVSGDCDKQVDEILRRIPAGSKTQRVLSFCFVDPWDLSMKFSTIKKIATRYVDFLVLLALNMDGNRNKTFYLDPRNQKIDEFLGMPNWREKWDAVPEPKSFPRFLAEAYAGQMQSLGYLPTGFEKMKPVRSDDRNLPLYHLALFSRHETAYKYWKDVLKYSSSQLGLGL